ncbi:ABC transporter permease subunit [Mycolicibacterium smegmatis]|uniref:Binding-protein-dependent transport systems inner membrane component n=3 Tax=Mycobacteriaceae TaxID=1762 RepID=I7G529_MYCS2|nr:ABC transporter permease subunit [Mycolicibacterium smegmatis]VTP03399.1 Bicarbonate transport system permease protein CmpB [Mycobacterium riyadhense]AAB41655.1 ORF5 [Mycolicibacterium smegmatis]AFP37674.1 Binding-protein-dependent transport systems inner membrane component [Mycolicibacterium smegmatis MC2 155]MCC3334421.1 ABC transporter permease subunit [Mycolicibacterium smegmatis]MCO4194120.1 ABC transporter permease subunit [Mycolicibacterium smegmatis]
MTDLMTRPTIAPPRLLSPGDPSGKTLRHKLVDHLPKSVVRRVPAVVLPLIPIAVFLTAWHLLTANNVVAWLRFNRMPSPDSVLQALLARISSGSYYDDLLASLQRILLGFGLAAVVGIALGVLVGRSEVARMTLRPFIELIRPIPAIALVPLTILLFPSSEQGIVFITFFAAFFPVVVSTIHAMDSMPKVWEEAAKTMGAGRMSLLIHVIIPGRCPAFSPACRWRWASRGSAW